MNKLLVAVTSLTVILFLSVALTVFLNTPKEANPSPVQNFGYSVINVYPHDTAAFTEGLVYADGFLYESTGLNGASSLRRTNLTSGEVVQEIELSSQFFGEGIALVNDTIIQLTWQSHIGFIYNKETFELLGNFSYSTEGWGLTFDGVHLIMSDGSDKLYFLDPVTFQQVSQVQVHDGNVSVRNLNELEYIKGDIYANIFQQRKIAVINPETGQVKGWVDLSDLSGQPQFNGENVLNGIAYDAKGDRLFVTGKDWPQLYQIRLISPK